MRFFLGFLLVALLNGLSTKDVEAQTAFREKSCSSRENTKFKSIDDYKTNRVILAVVNTAQGNRPLTLNIIQSNQSPSLFM